MPAKNGWCENCGLARGGAVDREKEASPASELSVTLGLGTMDLMHGAWVIRSDVYMITTRNYRLQNTLFSYVRQK